jgi:hypothetical protein
MALPAFSIPYKCLRLRRFGGNVAVTITGKSWQSGIIHSRRGVWSALARMLVPNAISKALECDRIKSEVKPLQLIS